MEQKCAVAPVGTEPACGSTPDPVQVKTPHHLLPFMIIYLTALSLSLLHRWMSPGLKDVTDKLTQTPAP